MLRHVTVVCRACYVYTAETHTIQYDKLQQRALKSQLYLPRHQTVNNELTYSY